MYIEAAHEGCDMNVKISRTRFEDLCFDLYKAAGGVITKALEEAGSATDKVDMVLLAGGERGRLEAESGVEIQCPRDEFWVDHTAGTAAVGLSARLFRAASKSYLWNLCERRHHQRLGRKNRPCLPV